MADVKALLFDIGEVVTTEQWHLLDAVEAQTGRTLVGRGPLDPDGDPVWQRYLTGEISFLTYWAEYAAVNGYDDWRQLFRDFPLDGDNFVHPEADRLIRDAQAAGLKIGALTNDGVGINGREFFDSMEEKISEVFHPDMTPQEMKAVLIQAQRTYAVDAPDGVTDGSIADEIHEIHKILHAAVTRKQEIHGRLESLTAAMKVRAAKAGYAVDSPDGEDDGHVQEEQHEVDRLINESSPASASKKQPVSGKDDMSKKRASDPEHW